MCFPNELKMRETQISCYAGIVQIVQRKFARVIVNILFKDAIKFIPTYLPLTPKICVHVCIYSITLQYLYAYIVDTYNHTNTGLNTLKI